MEGDLKTLKVKRGQIKAAASRFKNFLINFKADSSNVSEIKVRKEKFVQTWEQFNEIQTNIELLEKIETDEKEREDFEEIYFRLLSMCEEFVAKYDSKSTVNDKRSPLGDNLKLPSIELKSFSGQSEEWYPYYQLFKSMIHENTSLNEIQKFHYLRSTLTGRAADVVNALEITPENYNEAWNLLKERFDNKRLIVQTHIKAIFETPSVTRENFVGLRKMIDHIKRHLRALKTLGSDAVSGNDLICYLVLSKLDSGTQKEWEATLTKDSKPTIDNLLGFLTHKCDILEAVHKPQPQISKLNSAPNYKRVYQGGTAALAVPKVNCGKFDNKHGAHNIDNFKNLRVNDESKGKPCVICKGEHTILTCKAFQNLTSREKYEIVMQKGLCLNCLKPGIHIAKNCRSPGCKLCYKRHNVLLHESFENPESCNSSQKNKVQTETNENITTSNCALPERNFNSTILSTAVVQIIDNEGKVHNGRALLDSGSQSDFITKRLVQNLKLKQQPVNVSIVGVGQQNVSSLMRVKILVKSRVSDYCIEVSPFVLEKITETIPISSFTKDAMVIPPDFVLADANFNKSNEVDLLLGVNVFWDCMLNENFQIKNQPRLQKTKFGWIIGGGWNSKPYATQKLKSNVAVVDDIDINLSKFWETENVTTSFNFNPEDRYCIDHFQNTVKRDTEGRFIVELPIRLEKLGELGSNREQALKRFYGLEKRLEKFPKLKEDYVAFMREYLALGHMKEISENVTSYSSEPRFYIPHHCVINEKSLTTKLRVVFDASCKSQTGLSLNDILRTGPVLQQDLFSILVRYRMFIYVITADIKKMFRQIKIAPHQTALQRIFWRENPAEMIKVYELLTVTYGTAPASFLAINAVQELAKTECTRFPVGAKVALRDFYVDDLITGADSKEELAIIKQQIVDLLKLGGFELAKWSTNVPELLDESVNSSQSFSFDKNTTSRALGIIWSPATDELSYTIPYDIDKEIVTKRIMLRVISQIFDPLGLIGPFIITAKILLRTIWQIKLDWDERVPNDIHSMWRSYLDDMKFLKELKIARNITNGIKNYQKIELHGFCDASEDAYGGCIYIRTIDLNDKICTNLLCAKSRVAPLKTLSLPRLELCAAQLLTNLMVKVAKTLEIDPNAVYYWTDSKIVLSWLRARNKKWSVFVAHRVGFIQEYSATEKWRHVKSEENPADVISRGAKLGKLIGCELWWRGPEWLSKDGFLLEEDEINMNDDEIPEQRKIIVNCLSEQNFTLFDRCGSFKKLIRVTAYINKFITNCRQEKEQRNIECLSGKDLEEAEETLVKLVQREVFSEDILKLRKKEEISRSSKLLSLRPFLDEKGIIRVGGRLQNANLPFLTKHQMIIPGNHKFTKLLFLHEHKRLIHAGLQTTLATLRAKYWPIAGKGSLREIIRNCVICKKADPKVATHIMGNLPKERTMYCRPFSNIGVDYCGPFLIKENKIRTSKLYKAYVVVFVCLSFKAIHLEVASDLTSEAFVKAFERLSKRRGVVKVVFSDNATNFVGASKILDEVEWHFIPPRTPHFGGLWEASVKSLKFHLKRVVGESKLTFEDFSTLLIQIEAVLNSRPLTPVSNDINDYSCLTPAHFLVGDSLYVDSVANLDTSPVKFSTQWDLIQRLREHFWRRWQSEYLRNCQARVKWKTQGPPVSVGQLVMVMQDSGPPMKWVLGRIAEIFKGVDGVPRVVKVKTSSGEFKRGVNRIAPLPCCEVKVINNTETTRFQKGCK